MQLILLPQKSDPDNPLANFNRDQLKRLEREFLDYVQGSSVLCPRWEACGWNSLAVQRAWAGFVKTSYGHLRVCSE